jgi:regulator of sigma E protease
VWQRAAVVFAGPAINFIFAILVLAGLYVTYGQPVIPPTAAAIVAGSNAEKYGFKPHDKIIAMDGKRVDGFQDVRREIMVALDQEKAFIIEREGKLFEIKARAARKERTDRFGFKSETGVLGLISAEEGLQVSKITKIDGQSFSDPKLVMEEIKKRLGTSFRVEITRPNREPDVYIIAPAAERNKDLGTLDDINKEILLLSPFAAKEFKVHSVMTALQSAVKETYVITRSSLEALGQIITGVRSTNELGGIIRIGAIAGDMASQGIIPLIMLTAFLSINLGFINLLPIPVLDGGHLTFYAAEALLGKPVPEKIQEYAFNAGFFFLIGVMLFANLNDVWQLITHNI